MQMHLMGGHGRRRGCQRGRTHGGDGWTSTRPNGLVSLLLVRVLQRQLMDLLLLLLLLRPVGLLDRIGQGETQLVPEPILAPLQIRIGFEVELQIGVEVLVRDVANQDDDQALGLLVLRLAMSRSAKQLMQGRLVLEAAPFGFDEIGRDDHDGATGRVDRLADGLRQAVSASARGAIAMLKAEFVGRRAVLQVGGQHLLDEGVVFGAVRQEGVEEFAVGRCGRMIAGRPQAEAVTGVAPHAHRLPVNEDEQNEERDGYEGNQRGDQQRQIVLDDALLDDGGGRRRWADAQADAAVRGAVRAVVRAAVGAVQHFGHEDGQTGDDRIPFVGHANQLTSVGHFGAGRVQGRPKFGQEKAVAAPRVVVERQRVQLRRVRQEIPDGEVDQSIAVETQHLQVPQRREGAILNGRDGVVVQVELAQRLQVAELEALQRADAVVLQVEDVEAAQAVERPVVDDLDAARVEEEQTQVLAADELVRGEGAQLGAVQVQFRHVHRDPLRQVGVRGARAVDDVGRPRLVVVARAVGGARHLAVAGVEVAAVAQREAVRLVGAQEIGRRRLHQRHVGPLRPAAVQQTAIDALQVHDARMLAQVVGRVDALQPLPN